MTKEAENTCAIPAKIQNRPDPVFPHKTPKPLPPCGLMLLKPLASSASFAQESNKVTVPLHTQTLSSHYLLRLWSTKVSFQQHLQKGKKRGVGVFNLNIKSASKSSVVRRFCGITGRVSQSLPTIWTYLPTICAVDLEIPHSNSSRPWILKNLCENSKIIVVNEMIVVNID